MDTRQLIQHLQLLQRRLCEMAEDLGNLADPDIVAVSEEADRLIVQLQRLRMEEAEARRKRIRVPSGTILAASKSPEEISEQSGAFYLKHT